MSFLFDDNDEGKTHLLAFSGGPDSVYLLLALKKAYPDDLNQHVQLAYVNYHDSEHVDEEERIVRHYADQYGLALHRLDVRHEEKDGNFEDWARKIRYAFFKDILKKERLTDVLTAHHKDDAIETYLLQKERKNLPSYYGIKEESFLDGIVVRRPLLNVDKKTIYAFLDREKALYYEDITNHDDHTRRNLLRGKLSIEEKEKLQKEMTEKNASLSRLYLRFSFLPKEIPFLFYDSLEEDEKRRLLFFLLDKEDPSLSSERREGLGKEMYEFLKRQANGVLSLSEKVLYRSKDVFFIGKEIPSLSYEEQIDGPTTFSLPFLQIMIDDPDIFNHLSFPFTIRNARRGDRIGTNLVSKDVETFLKKQGVPFYLRKIYPVFVKDGKIVCVPFYKDIEEEIIPIKFIFD